MAATAPFSRFVDGLRQWGFSMAVIVGVRRRIFPNVADRPIGLVWLVRFALSGFIVLFSPCHCHLLCHFLALLRLQAFPGDRVQEPTSAPVTFHHGAANIDALG